MRSGRLARGVGPRPTLLLVLAAAACGEPVEELPPPWTLTDSSGVVVVENLRPALPGEGAWRLDPEPDVVLGRPAAWGDGDFGRPVDARFLPGGGVVVADGGFVGWQLVVAFDSTGTAVASCGGAGDTAERLQRLTWAAPWPGDSLVAYDAADGTAVIYPVPAPDRRRWSGPGSPGRELECDRGRAVELPDGVQAPGGTAVPTGAASVVVSLAAPDTSVGSASVGSAAAGPHAPRRPVVRVGGDGSVGDTLLRLDGTGRGRGAAASAPRPYPVEASLAATDSTVIHAPGRSFEARIHDADGRLVRIVRRAWEPVPLTSADRERWVAWSTGRRMTGGENPTRETRERMLRELPWPEAAPAVSKVVVADDGTLWMEGWRWTAGEIPPDPESTVWSVFSPTGRWVTDVGVPGRFLLTDVRGHRVVGIVLEDDGASEVRVHRLVR